MPNRRVTALTICVLGFATIAAGQNLYDLVIQKYGLSRLTQQNRDAVAGYITFAVRASSAIDNSGFRVYTLDQVIENGINDVYVWSDSSGRNFVTEHFIGVGAFTMVPGQSYLGNAGPLWLVLYKNGSDVKFTIK